MFRNCRYGWIAVVALTVGAVPAGAQAGGADDVDRSESSPRSEDSPGPEDRALPDRDGDDLSSAATTAGDGSPKSKTLPPDDRAKKKKRMPRHVALRLRALSKNLTALSRKGSSAVADGVLSLGLGGVSIALGIFVNDPSLPTYLYVFGSIHAVRGVMGMVLVPDPAEPALRFAHMPMNSAREIKLRLRYGERSFRSLADGNFWARTVDGTLNISAGLLVVPLALIRDDFEFDTALDYFVVAGAGVSVLFGVIELLAHTEAEKRHDAYRKFRGKLKRKWLERRRQKQRRSARLQAGLAPTANGGAIVVWGYF